MKFKNFLWLTLFILVPSVLCTPIVLPQELQVVAEFPTNFCYLSKEFGYSGTAEFIEDCPYESLDRFDKVPKLAELSQRHSLHPKVCCPEYLHPNHSCFPTDPWCPSYRSPPPLDQETINTVNDYLRAKVSDGVANCAPYGQFVSLPGVGELSQCVSLSRCSSLMDTEDAPITRTIACGFDESLNQMMVCCPEDLVTDVVPLHQPPRYPDTTGAARPVRDRSVFCSRWRENGGCRLDENIIISVDDPHNGVVESWEMFEFMSLVCLDTCGWAGDKGCVDEHPRCGEWARSGLCNIQVLGFMGHTCRESCGTCGFLSTTSTEDQVVAGNSYSDYKDDNFDCGRYKRLCEITGEECDVETEEADDDDAVDLRRPSRQAPEEEDDDRYVLFSFDPTKPDEYFCGATIVSDRFIVAAAHCYDQFEGPVENNQVKINTFRDNTQYKELIEIKKVFKHPQYQFPSLYNDVAVVELGRRIEYNYDKYGDTPTCLDQGKYDIVGNIATVQGYGETEGGTRGELLEANVTVISNDQCTEYLSYNSSLNNKVKEKIKGALANGINYGLLCGQGLYNEERQAFSGSCKGDSGGPLKTSFNRRDTLIGIVSGGVGCGEGIPNWYTKVSFFYPWIDCVISTSRMTGGSRLEVSKKCDPVAQNLIPTCLQAEDLIFELRAAETLDTFKIDLCEENNNINIST